MKKERIGQNSSCFRRKNLKRFFENQCNRHSIPFNCPGDLSTSPMGDDSGWYYDHDDDHDDDGDDEKCFLIGGQ